MEKHAADPRWKARVRRFSREGLAAFTGARRRLEAAMEAAMA